MSMAGVIVRNKTMALLVGFFSAQGALATNGEDLRKGTVITVCVNFSINSASYFAKKSSDSDFFLSQESQIAAQFAQDIDTNLRQYHSQTLKFSSESKRATEMLQIPSCRNDNIKIFAEVKPVARQRGANQVAYNVYVNHKQKAFKFFSKTSYNFSGRYPQDPYGGIMSDMRLQAKKISLFIVREF